MSAIGPTVTPASGGSIGTLPTDPVVSGTSPWANGVVPLGVRSGYGLPEHREYTPPAPTPSPFEQPPSSIVGGSMVLSQNPQLVSKSGQGTDAQYAAEEAMLRENIRQQYNDVLQHLGYKDPSSGNFAMGDVELDAYRQERDLDRQRQLAVQDTTNQMQREGTLFSGYRGTVQGLSERPFISAIADITTDLPTKLAQYYTQSQNLMSDYGVQQALLLVQAADRYAARLAASSTGGGTPAGGSGGTGGGDGAAPPPGTGAIGGGHGVEPAPAPTQISNLGLSADEIAALTNQGYNASSFGGAVLP